MPTRPLRLLAATLALSGCALTQQKPAAPRQTCAPETVALMRKLRVEPGQQGQLTLEAQQPGSAQDYGVYRQGQLTSQLMAPLGDLPAGTLLEGVLWMQTGKVQGHYTQAHTPDGQTYPVCLVLGSSTPGGLYAEAGSSPGALTLPRRVPFVTVSQFE